ncbi:hypothetical protein [Streptomyces pseudovenezuelae]|uniref:hypothetical protein n=1 Tax=Streptomyces pseudovenezuelae TaxID=67350 RepID=UPI002E37B4A0|nr:hypothetical protein [Streptomyces pseudovenezuelae]
MRRGTQALWILYAGLALALLAAALLASQREQYPTAALLAAAAIGLAMAIPHTAWLLEEYRHLLGRADADNRALARAEAGHRPALTTRQDVQVRQILAAACCDTWWATAGAEHDPDHCTRKDQTT